MLRENCLRQNFSLDDQKDAYTHVSKNEFWLTYSYETWTTTKGDE